MTCVMNMTIYQLDMCIHDGKFSEDDGKMQGSGRSMDDEEEMTEAEKTEVKKIAYTYRSRKRFHAFGQ